jgi:hypothetical protein
MYRLESVLFLWRVHTSDVRPWAVLFVCALLIFIITHGKCSVFMHNTYFWFSVWKVLCFSAQYIFMTYRQESVLILCTVHISHVEWWKCSVSVHITYVYFWWTWSECSVSVYSTYFWSTTWNVFCLCAQYIFLIFRLKCVLFLCTFHILDPHWCHFSLSNLLPCTDANVLCCLYCFVWFHRGKNISSHLQNM